MTKEKWIWIGVSAFVLILAIIIFCGGKDNKTETAPKQPTNIYLIAGNIQTTKEEIDDYCYYTSSGQIVVSAHKIGGFSGQLTLTGEDIEKTVKMDGVMNSYIFSELDTEKAYSIFCDGLDDCVITISEKVSDSDIPLYMTIPINLNSGEFTTTADDIYKYSFQTNSTKIYVTVNNSDSFEGEILLWTTIDGCNNIQSCDVEIWSNSCEFTKLRSSYWYQISCENLDGCEIVLSTR